VPLDLRLTATECNEHRERQQLTGFHVDGARTAWHSHAVGQTLHATDSVGLVQARGGRVIVIRPGNGIYTPPGEWLWHGAAPDNFMVHTAIFEAPADGPEAEWGDHVTDTEYLYPG
jgi:quercetin dioxygenase-like cupin family protein